MKIRSSICGGRLELGTSYEAAPKPLWARPEAGTGVCLVKNTLAAPLLVLQEMRCGVFFKLAAGPITLLPYVTGFVVLSTSFVSRSRTRSCVDVQRGASALSGRRYPMKRRTGNSVSREGDIFVMRGDRLTDAELDSVKLDSSTLSPSEKERVEGIRAIQSKILEVDAKKQEMWQAERKAAMQADLDARTAEEDAGAGSASPMANDEMTEEERRRAEGMASIERSLAEVEDIQRQLGIAVDEDEDEKDLEVVDTAWRGQAGLDVSGSDGEARNWSALANRKVLAAGDLAALTLFSYVGRASHGMADFDLGVLLTALPFMIGWLALSPLLGAYTKSSTASLGDAAKSLLPAWGVSIPFAVFLRALSKGGEVPPIPFAVTSMIFTFVALLSWRGLYTAVNPTGEGDKKAGILDGFRMITTLLQRW